MSDAIIVALITGGLSLTGVVISLVLQRKWKKQDQQHVVVEQLSELKQRLDKMEADNETREIKHVRIRLLRFGDECTHGVKHSREHFDQVIEDVDAYEEYCREHPEFKNNKANLTMQIIKDTYRKRLIENDFE